MGCGSSTPVQENERMERVLDSAAPEGTSCLAVDCGACGAGGTLVRPNAALVADVYEFGDILGTGGFATVWLATKKSSGKKVALKVLNLPSKYFQASHRDDVFYEIGVLATLNSEFVIRMDEFFVEANKAYIATELLSGGDLLEALIQARHYDEPMARRIFRRVLQGMVYLHGVGITHRDMKLANLLLGNAGDVDSVKICDLGLAKKATEKIKNAMIGTPRYVSPEIIFSEHPTRSFGPAVDNWACGVILYILLSGYPPFEHSDEIMLYGQIRAGRYQWPAWSMDKVSQEAKDLVAAFLTVDEHQRITAAQALEHPWFTMERRRRAVDEAPKAGEDGDDLPVAVDQEGQQGGGLRRLLHLSESQEDLQNYRRKYLSDTNAVVADGRWGKQSKSPTFKRNDSSGNFAEYLSRTAGSVEKLLTPGKPGSTGHGIP